MPAVSCILNKINHQPGLQTLLSSCKAVLGKQPTGLSFLDTFFGFLFADDFDSFTLLRSLFLIQKRRILTCILKESLIAVLAAKWPSTSLPLASVPSALCVQRNL